MTPGEALAQRVLTDPAIANLIGTRFGPSMPDQDPPGDYAIYYRIGGGDGKNLGGPSRVRPHLMRVEAFAETEARAEVILSAIKTRLDGWRDRPSGVHGCFATADADEQVADRSRRTSGQTFELWFKG